MDFGDNEPFELLFGRKEMPLELKENVEIMVHPFSYCMGT